MQINNHEEAANAMGALIDFCLRENAEFKSLTGDGMWRKLWNMGDRISRLEERIQACPRISMTL